MIEILEFQQNRIQYQFCCVSYFGSSFVYPILFDILYNASPNIQNIVLATDKRLDNSQII